MGLNVGDKIRRPRGKVVYRVESIKRGTWHRGSVVYARQIQTGKLYQLELYLPWVKVKGFNPIKKLKKLNLK